ncbi:MAG: UbiA prenyltransferase family protein, partial [Planctomycetes bacterium]|nr:UbiA prenyltransferase family protein [Planctomycetota bacterium]
MTRTGRDSARAAAVWTWVTCAAAVLCLPRTTFPIPWIAAFVLPALLFYALRRRVGLDFGWAVAVSGATHIATVLAAQWLHPDIEHVTALGCALLPPMVFLAARRHRDDTTWALFLALCVFLIAVIVAGQRSAWSWRLWAFIGTALVALQLETRARAAAKARIEILDVGSRRQTLASVTGQLLMAIAVATIVMQGLERIRQRARPLPQFRDSESSAGHGQVGLNDKFEFGPAAQQLFDLEHNELVRVTAQGLDHELYLRTAHFELAGLDRWSKAQPREQDPMFEEDVRHLGYPSVDVTTDRITIETNENTGRFLFLPPGTMRVVGVGLVYGNPRRERFQRLETGPVTYTVEFQDRRPIATDRPFDPEFRSLARLPRELGPHLSHFDRVLDDAAIARDASPIEAARAITAVLQRDCEYEMREPT